MLRQLSIKNYALIDQLTFSFDEGFTVITGETGSGKSILLGALGLILGKRADSSVIYETSQKCIVEGIIDISKFNLRTFFQNEDLDYEDRSIFRREVLASGKSRAFINDTPVSLSLLKSIGSRLVDIHSQHDVLMLKTNSIQLNALDAFAKNESIKKKYLSCYDKWESFRREYAKLKDQITSSNLDKDYIEFQLKELQDAGLKVGERQDLESELEKVEYAEEVKIALSHADQLLGSENGVVGNSLDVEQILSKIQSKSPAYASLFERMKSVRLELTDISATLEDELQSVEINPASLDKIRQRLDMLYRLESKHKVNNTDELIAVEERLSSSIIEAGELELKLQDLQLKIESQETALASISAKLTDSRKKKSASFEKKIKTILAELSMEKASIRVDMESLKEYSKSGKDQVNFAFSANSGMGFQDLKKVASGGEMSRVMLAIKSILADKGDLPVLIFDEIDTGISGKVSSKVAQLMLKIADSRQVFAITHQAQVASQGHHHYKVLKVEEGKRTLTKVIELSQKERINEIAEMLSGEKLSKHSIANASELLKQHAG